jgi:hypothetical protein
MYKYPTIWTLSDGKGNTKEAIQSFKTKEDFEAWENYQLMNGFKIMDQFDFKAELRKKIIERYGQEYFDLNYGNDN